MVIHWPWCSNYNSFVQKQFFYPHPLGIAALCTVCSNVSEQTIHVSFTSSFFWDVGNNLSFLYFRYVLKHWKLSKKIVSSYTEFELIKFGIITNLLYYLYHLCSHLNIQWNIHTHTHKHTHTHTHSSAD